MIPDVRYATTPQSVHISYLVIGEGPIDIVFPGWGYSNIEYAWRILDAVGDEGTGLAEMWTRAPSEWGLRLMGASPKVVHLAGRPCSSFADQLQVDVAFLPGVSKQRGAPAPRK